MAVEGESKVFGLAIVEPVSLEEGGGFFLSYRS
jgi:hypothetical protein